MPGALGPFTISSQLIMLNMISTVQYEDQQRIRAVGVRSSASGAGDKGSTPGRVLPMGLKNCSYDFHPWRSGLRGVPVIYSGNAVI